MPRVAPPLIPPLDLWSIVIPTPVMFMFCSNMKTDGREPVRKVIGINTFIANCKQKWRTARAGRSDASRVVTNHAEATRFGCERRATRSKP